MDIKYFLVIIFMTFSNERNPFNYRNIVEIRLFEI